MSIRLALDTSVLGLLCHPRSEEGRQVARWLTQTLRDGDPDTAIFLPEIADYELRRKLIHMAKKSGRLTSASLKRLDQLSRLLTFLPLDTPTIRAAAELWADARGRGLPTASDAALDGDVILAVQARAVGAKVLTTNVKHLRPLVEVVGLDELLPLEP